MSKAKILTKHIAERFLKDEDSVDLQTFTSTSDAAAQALAQHNGDLNLEGLTSLSDEAAQALAQHKGKLYLSGLTSLSDAAAQALAKHKGYLNLSGLTSLSDGAAQALSQHEDKDGRLRLSQIARRAVEQSRKNTRAVDPETKEQLAKVKKLITANNADNFALAVELVRSLGLDNEATWLSLLAESRIAQLVKLADSRVTNLLLEIAGTGQAIWLHVMRKLTTLYNPKTWCRYFEYPSLTSLSDEAAQALAKHEGNLYLSGLTTLSDRAAQALSQHKGGWLYLDGLTSLSDGAAQALSQHKGGLRLDGLTSLSDGAAQALSQHKVKLKPLITNPPITTDPTDSTVFYQEGRPFRYENGYRLYLDSKGF
jgi:hypothetical protein